ncbi:type 1 glutamine amidotransferase [Aquibacillus albus]|uniref:GMP synthase-like glutamine amidotransferase n=1 Tax=Aquibacillus albus TaxID=1168171 RepID=A0ABS2N5F5_9BACI|nr:hypothetical protein [Aquibacillus albus]MBM7573357.1 GMP synthase-like glutamine amidotransferase [Aquibacillus albus]
MYSDVDVIVLEADGAVDDSNHGYGHHIMNNLQKFGYNTALISLAENVDHLHELPEKPIIISGGMTEVTADIDWIVKAKNFMKTKMNENRKKRDKTKILGICFGAQLIAESNKEGSVTFLKPPQMGISEINLEQPDHSLFKGFDSTLHAFSFHYNQIKTDNVNIISSHQKGDRDFVQAFEIPDVGCYGVQFHPEIQLSAFNHLIGKYKSLLEEDLGVEIKEIIEGLPTPEVDNTKLLKNFMEMVG